MNYLHSFLFLIHIVVGSLALILFWVPFATAKGELNHKRYGRHYKTAMYIVAASGALMSIMVMSMPAQLKGNIVNNAQDQAAAVDFVRLFWGFLLYLSVLSFTTTKHALSVVRVKEKRHYLRTWSYLLPILLLIIASPVLFYAGFIAEQQLHMIFSVIGLLAGIGMLKYCLKSHAKPKAWILEHISSFIGSGIGAYTAFLAFGGRTMLASFGDWRIAFWIGPSLIGTIAIILLCSRYKQIYRI